MWRLTLWGRLQLWKQRTLAICTQRGRRSVRLCGRTLVRRLGDEQLAREKFTGELIERVGETGLKWQGIRVACEPKHRDLLWLKVEAEYLTLPGSDLLALIYRWTNLSNARESVYGGMAIWAAVGGDRGQSIAHWANSGELRHRSISPGMDINNTRWAVIENAVTGSRLEAMYPNRRLDCCQRHVRDPELVANPSLTPARRARLSPG